MNHTESPTQSTSPSHEENTQMLTPAPNTDQTAQQNRQETTAMTSPASSRRALFPVRTLVVLLLAAIVGAVAGLVTFALTHDLAKAVGAGFGIAGTVAMGHDTLVE